ncbi:MAG: GerMN domain-containing protein [Clostridia bacterium]|nr:GerMN domain-containing protein [Clostridia bacterium]
MKKFKLLFLIVLFVGCIWYTNALEQQEVAANDLEVAKESGENLSKVLLYFLNSENELVNEYRFVSLDDLKTDMPKLIMTELLNGPSIEENKSALPDGVQLISIEIRDNVASVNFSKEFVSQSEGEDARLAKISAVVNTLTEIKEIDTVEILVEGEVYEVRGRI